MARKNRRENKDKMCKAAKFAEVHNCEIEDFEDRDEDDDWLNNNY